MGTFRSLLEVHAALPSTMDEARRRADAGALEGTTILAREQSAGVGRRGRRWFSPAGGLYMTVLLRPEDIAPENRPPLALVAGVAVAQALSAVGAEAVRLKWPNDLIVGRKKLGGILLSATEDAVFVGIGINHSERGAIELPDDVQFRFLGLADLLETPPRPEDLAPEVLDRLEECYLLYRTQGLVAFRASYARLDGIRGQRVRVTQTEGMLEGRADGIDEAGNLRVITETGVECVGSGEVVAVRFGI